MDKKLKFRKNAPNLKKNHANGLKMSKNEFCLPSIDE